MFSNAALAYQTQQNAMQTNLYQYANNNPVIFVDPSGLQACHTCPPCPPPFTRIDPSTSRPHYDKSKNACCYGGHTHFYQYFGPGPWPDCKCAAKETGFSCTGYYGPPGVPCQNPAPPIPVPVPVPVPSPQPGPGTITVIIGGIVVVVGAIICIACECCYDLEGNPIFRGGGGIGAPVTA